MSEANASPEKNQREKFSLKKTLKRIPEGARRFNRAIKEDYIQNENKAKRWVGRLVYYGVRIVPATVAIGAIILGLNQFVGQERSITTVTNPNRDNRPQRLELYMNDDGILNTNAEKWAAGIWTGHSAYDLRANFNPAGPVTEPMVFLETCGPQCFFDPKHFPKSGWPVMGEILGLMPGEYEYYSNHLSEWETIKGELIEQLREKYPADSDYPWLPDMFNLSPTDPKSREPSDFENWYNQWHDTELQGFNPDITTARGRIQAVGINQFKNAFAGRQNFSGAAAKGRGFGTNKGFS